MDEQQIRRLVRQAIARHLGTMEAAPPVAAPQPAVPAPGSPSRPAPPAASGVLVAADRHVSAARFVILRPPEDTACIVEPSAPCNHCGYCQCLGH